MQALHPDRRPLAAGLLAVAVVFVARAWSSIPTAVDDAYISARYARHLALGNGLVYNAGEPPIEGYTNLAFVVLSALLWRLGLDMHTVVVGLGLLFALLGLIAVTGLTWTLIPEASGSRRPFWALAPAIVLALDPHYAVVASNGIESSMFLAGIVAACWATFTATGAGRWGAALLVGLLVAIRPEGIAVALALVGYDLLTHRRELWQPSSWAITAGALAFALPVWIGRYLYFGEWVPNTFAAKFHRDLWAQIAFDLRYLGPDWPFWVIAALLLVYGAIAGRRDLRRATAAAIALGLVVVAFQVDMWMPGGRLLLPSFALALALAAAAAPLRPAVGAGVIALMAVPLLLGPLPAHVLTYDRIHSAMPGNPAERAALHLAEHAPPGSVLATRDAGVLAYFVGPHVNVAELHERALTRPHPDGGEARVLEYTPVNPELFIATVQREKQSGSRYPSDRKVFRRLDVPYRYLGRVYQHYHRYYDVYVRADLDIPPLPDEIVVNRAGPPPPIDADADAPATTER